ncbi:Transcriptional regulator, AraC family [Cronobacter dublinensis 1210]|uniref:Transcriptional regulator, AraC family n=1 Tax=Cronobacter dublinensis 1210 TaxID=1208656 RepID=A0ABM9Q2B4_9ENTR|nr:Transcriptional regulator, AraC family [Cronobacter dublinensis 1210]
MRALSHPQEAQILGPAIVKELYYRVLMGEQGGAIRAALASVGKFSRIARVLQRIHTDYAGRLDVATLAAEAGMSAPAFHAHFKAVTRNSPVQYIKAVRLHQARLMMIRDNLSAATAAVRVGYESPSQFNREFRRLFGRTPGAETREMKQSFALLPPTQFEAMTANH